MNDSYFVVFSFFVVCLRYFVFFIGRAGGVVRIVTPLVGVHCEVDVNYSTWVAYGYVV